VKRFPAFDPPEYIDWKADPALVRAFRSSLEANPDRAKVIAGLSRDAKLELYRGLLRARLHDIELKRWVRTGVISKAWLGTGEEAAKTRARVVRETIQGYGAALTRGLAEAEGEQQPATSGHDLGGVAWQRPAAPLAPRSARCRAPPRPAAGQRLRQHPLHVHLPDQRPVREGGVRQHETAERDPDGTGAEPQVGRWRDVGPGQQRLRHPERAQHL